MATKTGTAEPEVDSFAGPDLDEPFAFEPDAPAEPVDPTMDPSHVRWNPKKYFDAQPKEIIVVKRTESDILSDPAGERKITIKPGINGYSIEITKGVPTRVPRDFAHMLVTLGAAYRYSDIAEAG